MRILIIGAGFSGSVIARQLAEANHTVVVIDKRCHIGGNAYDSTNKHGIRVHKYGPHLFHTKNEEVWNWLGRFTTWIPYQHKVKALLDDGRYVTLPVNKETSEIVGKENVVDTFIRPYTKKMWGLDIEQIDPTILQRVPIRDDMNELYFPNDPFQGMPKDGYTAMFEEMLDHPNITVHTGREYDPYVDPDWADHIFSSMPIDEFYNYRFGPLPYRSIKFHTSTVPVKKLLPATTVNFTNSGPYTRMTEWKNIAGHGENEFVTTITYEEPCDYLDNNFERYYPVKDLAGKNKEIYQQYLRHSLAVDPHVTMIGRCGLYTYLDMTDAVAIALNISKKFIKEHNS